MIKISVSDLDAYAWYEASEQTTEDFIARLRRQEPPTEAMMAGTAVHEALEKCAEGDTIHDMIITVSERNKGNDDRPWREGQRVFLITTSEMDATLFAPRIREQKERIIIPTTSGDVQLTGKADYIHDGECGDYKVTQRPNFDRYFESMQWRCYLFIFGCKRFRYVIFKSKIKPPTRSATKLYDSEVHIESMQQLVLYSYPNLTDDVYHAVDKLACFMRENMEECRND